MAKLDDMGEAFARLTMLEFVLEVVLGNELANQDETSSNQFKRDLVEHSKTGYGPLSADPDSIAYMHAVGHRSTEMMEQFVKKVARREAECRQMKRNA